MNSTDKEENACFEAVFVLKSGIFVEYMPRVFDNKLTKASGEIIKVGRNRD
jgi:hypothetical protein